MRSLRDLMQIFDFTADDLTANQRGLLSERQRARLRDGLTTERSADAGRGLALIVLAGGAGLCSAFAGVTGIANFFADAPLETRLFALVIGGVALVGAVVFIRAATTQAAYRYYSGQARRAALLADAEGGRVERVSGPIVYDAARYLDSGTLDDWEVGGQRFPFVAERHTALLDEAAYQVYYTPNARVIVAVEPAE